jgi:two-component system, NtrC family, nitrogen regulation sensor histidine kinase NtrY
MARSTLEARLALASGISVAVAVGLFAALSAVGATLVLAALLALAAGLIAAVLVAGVLWRPFAAALRGIADGVRGFQENDFGFRLTATGDREIDELVGLYNRMGDVLRGERNEIYQRELLLDTLLQGAPMAILLFNPLDRVTYANAAARRLFARVGRLEGLLRADLESPATALRAALLAGADTNVVAVNAVGEEETYRLVFRTFQLNGHPHTLAVVEGLTRDVRRQELSAWRKVIRVVSHEVNNSLAPVSSLVHSARLAAQLPQHAARLEDILVTIEERVRHLSGFLEGYASLARLPDPRPERVAWAQFLKSVCRAMPFTVIGTPEPATSVFDPAQIQQVLLNLLKNAMEAGSREEELAVSVEPAPGGGCLLRVLDRGAGMDDVAMRQAGLPLSAADRGGRGLGLPLCAEILAAHGGELVVAPRPGGGTVVTCHLPRDLRETAIIGRDVEKARPPVTP